MAGSQTRHTDQFSVTTVSHDRFNTSKVELFTSRKKALAFGKRAVKIGARSATVRDIRPPAKTKGYAVVNKRIELVRQYPPAHAA